MLLRIVGTHAHLISPDQPCSPAKRGQVSEGAVSCGAPQRGRHLLQAVWVVHRPQQMQDCIPAVRLHRHAQWCGRAGPPVQCQSRPRRSCLRLAASRAAGFAVLLLRAAVRSFQDVGKEGAAARKQLRVGRQGGAARRQEQHVCLPHKWLRGAAQVGWLSWC